MQRSAWMPVEGGHPTPGSCQPPRHSIPAALVGLGTAAPLIPDALLILVSFSLNFCPGREALCAVDQKPGSQMFDSDMGLDLPSASARSDR